MLETGIKIRTCNQETYKITKIITLRIKRKEVNNKETLNLTIEEHRQIKTPKKDTINPDLTKIKILHPLESISSNPNQIRTNSLLTNNL